MAGDRTNLEGSQPNATGDKTMTYYVDHCPRGFTNERIVRGFATKAERQSWLNSFDYDDVNASACAIDFKKARRLIDYRGDDATQSFNCFVDMRER
jgi:hypothetical protein